MVLRRAKVSGLLRSTLESGRAASAFVPWTVLRAGLASTLRGLDVTLYLHRVGSERRSLDPQPSLTIAADTLDEVLDVLSLAVPETRVTASFDDGYADAIAYVDARATRFPRVDFLVNVCPQKLEQRAGFRWDLFESERTKGSDPGPYEAFLADGADIHREHTRAELLALGDDPRFRLASVAAVRALARHSNVRLGNHSNCHLPLTALTDADATRELRQSTEDFTRIFGFPPKDFAFPFGTPGRHFHDAHVETLRALGVSRIYSTRESPAPRDATLIPRIHLVGTWSAKRMVAWIVERALKYRVRARFS